jgi:hypothetical protein
MPKLPTAPTPGEDQPDGDAWDHILPGRSVQRAVLVALGRPPDLYGVAVRPLWENRYRVNVLVGPDPTSVRIAHSYFVEAGEAGDILSATPRITRLYA